MVMSSGNANAATGKRWRGRARTMCALVARELGCPQEAVLVCSTELIGSALPMDAVAAEVPRWWPGVVAAPAAGSPPPRRS